MAVDVMNLESCFFFFFLNQHQQSNLGSMCSRCLSLHLHSLFAEDLDLCVWHIALVTTVVSAGVCCTVTLQWRWTMNDRLWWTVSCGSNRCTVAREPATRCAFCKMSVSRNTAITICRPLISEKLVRFFGQISFY